MTSTSTVFRFAWMSIAALLLGAALLGAPAHGAQPPAPGQAETTPAPPPEQAGQPAPPVGAVGFGWG